MSFTDNNNNNTASSTGMDTEYTDGPAAGTNSDAFSQSPDQGAYSDLQSGQGASDMGGGGGAMGSGVAGGYEGNSQQSQASAATGEKADWLDKGMMGLGKKFGVNINQKNADSAGDFANKEAKEKFGRNIPGVN
ncbi:hypothetical protein L226DRAFT_609864 [Lentinus tigrinus ALCF2SS1-7]|uniref:Uncharacterized protein n=1 Tax=Lentinus tigrinus ALCF2SS1-6 TaxID=1328759 RepID=A0A5C2SN52_9APHY|nr:hypothetical protein L227DRAFT_606755 [Lentinus tigrinus ALCF2SS1-6]RPD79400.1 hypothetical protein L226DRAFT_609864 [Lentinus tigrinus ALCF2SS1-7]